MDYKIVWSDRSLNNLREIVEFIAQDNSFAALKLGNSILKKTELLRQFPEAGKIFRV